MDEDDWHANEAGEMDVRSKYLKDVIACSKQTVADFKKGDLVEMIIADPDLDDRDPHGIVVGADEKVGFVDVLFADLEMPAWVDPRYLKKVTSVIRDLERAFAEWEKQSKEGGKR